MKPVILVFGPTASGKTALSLFLAKAFDGEIVGADSMQIYRKMDIGTAKASAEERAQIPHHLIDICDISVAYSAAQYREDALRAIDDILARQKLPIVVGGTGLYFDSLLYVPSYGNTPTNPEIRRELNRRLALVGSEALHEELCKADPKSGERIHKNDEKRIIRALEIYLATGKAPSEVLSREKNTDYQFLSFYLNYEQRADLYQACDRRVLQMIEDGLVDEVRALFREGLADSPTAAQAIGYKELSAYLSGASTLEEAVADIQKRTRNYAKRQITWFSKMEATSLRANCAEDLKTAHTMTQEFLKGALC